MDAQDDRWRQAVAYADEWLPAYRDAHETHYRSTDGRLEFGISAIAVVRDGQTPAQDARIHAFGEVLAARSAVRR